MGRAVNHPGQTSRNDSLSLLKPVAVGSRSQRASVLINTLPGAEVSLREKRAQKTLHPQRHQLEA